MDGRAELHFHVLPGVDDGPAGIEESVELARLAAADGTTTIVATPHVRNVDPAELPQRVEELARRLQERGVGLDLRCGGELAYDDVPLLEPAQVDLMAHGPPGARWVLLEAPLPHTPGTAMDLGDAARALREQGFAVLLGHPERAPVLFEDGVRPLRDELAAGSVLQINATSLTGAHGDEARERAFALLESSPAVVASDAHRQSRGPALSAAVKALAARGLPEQRADAMTRARPRRLLDEGIPLRRPGARDLRPMVRAPYS